MEDFLKMDIFFAVTTLAVVVLTILLGIVLWYIIRILKHIEHTSEIVSEESELIRDDIGDLRGRVRKEGLKMAHFASFIGMITKRFRKKRAKNKE